MPSVLHLTTTTVDFLGYPPPSGTLIEFFSGNDTLNFLLICKAENIDTRPFLGEADNSSPFSQILQEALQKSIYYN